jgi:hypothetical protein
VNMKRGRARHGTGTSPAGVTLISVATILPQTPSAGDETSVRRCVRGRGAGAGSGMPGFPISSPPFGYWRSARRSSQEAA